MHDDALLINSRYYNMYFFCSKIVQGLPVISPGLRIRLDRRPDPDLTSKKPGFDLKKIRIQIRIRHIKNHTYYFKMPNYNY